MVTFWIYVAVDLADVDKLKSLNHVYRLNTRNCRTAYSNTNMASMINPFFSPNSGDRPWVDQISKTLKTQLAITINTPPVCIFQVPNTLTTNNLKAYVPQAIGLGPKHHFQPELYEKAEQYKLTAMKRVLRSRQIKDFQKQIVNKVREIVPVIFACYNWYFDADDDTLAWLFAIDGLFLLDQLNARTDQRSEIEARDLILVENQIPLVVLKEIQRALSGDTSDAQDDFLESKFQAFCETHSPLRLNHKKIEFNQVNHLLDYMYHSIVDNETTKCVKFVFRNHGSSTAPGQEAKPEKFLEEVVESAEKLAPGASTVVAPIVNFLKETFLESNEKIEEIKVPSVSELHDIAKVKFRLSDGGIRNIKFLLDQERTFYLPNIKLHPNSEVILRNLVAYEKLMAKESFTAGYSLELTEYVDFMCGIIDTAKDVKLLREEKIIEGDLENEEIVNLFNAIRRSKLETINGEESELRKTVAQVNQVYGSVPRVMVWRSAEKQFQASANVLKFLVSISSTLIFLREVYYMVFGSNPPHTMLVHFLESKIKLFLH